MPKNYDLLECDTPESFPEILRAAADKFRESTGELQSAWQDKNAGIIWSKFATILDRAAKSADTVLSKGY